MTSITLKTKKEAWLHAIRLRTLPLALSSIFMGSVLAFKQNALRWEIMGLAILTTIFLQILSNLANDYGDSVHGADSPERSGPIRSVQSGLISLQEMKRAMILFGLLSFASGIALIYLALPDWRIFLFFLLLGIISIAAAITYTAGKSPYGYLGFGDLSVFLFFGLVGVLGTYYLHTLDWQTINLLPAFSLGFFSTAVLNINNIRDITSDEIAGKKSIPVRIGRANAVVYNWILIIIGNLSMIIYVLLSGNEGALAAIMILPLMIIVGKSVAEKKEAELLDPYLKKMAISTFLWVLAFSIGIIIL